MAKTAQTQVKQLAVKVTSGKSETTAFLVMLILAIVFLTSSRWGAVWSVITGQPGSSAPLTGSQPKVAAGGSKTATGVDTSTAPISSVPGALAPGQSPSIPQQMDEVLRTTADATLVDVGTAIASPFVAIWHAITGKG